MTDTPDRLKRLIYRSRYTGTKETDTLLGAFAERLLPTLTAAQLDTYERLLEAGDSDLYMWISRRKPVPEAWDSDVMALLQDFKVTP